MELYLDVVRHVSAQWTSSAFPQLPSIDSILRDYERIVVNAQKIEPLAGVGSWIVGGWTQSDTLKSDEWIFGIKAKREAFIGSFGNDLIKAYGRNDLAFGGKGDDVLYGGDGGEILVGGDDWDKLYGDVGADTLVGGFGFDKMWGGDGTDSFVFHDYRETNSQQVADKVDTIFVFQGGVGGDVIDLRDIDANWKTPENDFFRFKGTDAFTGKSGQLRFEQNVDTIIMGDCDGDGVADFRIALSGIVTLSRTNFLL